MHFITTFGDFFSREPSSIKQFTNMNKISLSAVFMLILASCFEFHQGAVLRLRAEEHIRRNDTSVNSTSDLRQQIEFSQGAGLRLEADEQQVDAAVYSTSELRRHTRDIFPTMITTIDDTQLDAELTDVMERLVNINGSAFAILKENRELRPFVGDECSPLAEFNLPTVPSTMSGNKMMTLNTIKGLMRTMSDTVELARQKEIMKMCPHQDRDSVCVNPTMCGSSNTDDVKNVCKMSTLRVPEQWTAVTPTPTFANQNKFSKFKLNRFTASVLCRELEMIAEFVKHIIEVLGM